jgi:hypothetical protein
MVTEDTWLLSSACGSQFQGAEAAACNQTQDTAGRPPDKLAQWYCVPCACHVQCAMHVRHVSCFKHLAAASLLWGSPCAQLWQLHACMCHAGFCNSMLQMLYFMLVFAAMCVMRWAVEARQSAAGR